jgi:hypothetical protein
MYLGTHLKKKTFLHTVLDVATLATLYVMYVDPHMHIIRNIY